MPTKDELIDVFMAIFDDWEYNCVSDVPDKIRRRLYDKVGEETIFRMALAKMTKDEIQRLMDDAKIDSINEC